VHLFSFGHPIVGDKIYQIKSIKPAKDLDRIFLHASFLQFTGIQGEIKRFQVDLSSELKNYLIKLKGC